MTRPVGKFLQRQAFLRPLRLLNLYRRSRRSRPDWSRILTDAERSALVPAAGGPRILMATSVGLHLVVSAADSLFAAALLARGAEVDILLCDAALPACLACEWKWFSGAGGFAESGPRRLCGACFEPAAKMFGSLPVRIRRYSDFLNDEDRAWASKCAAEVPLADVAQFTGNRLPLGEQAMAGALRFIARGDLTNEPHAQQIVQRYLEASLLTARAAERLYQKGRYDAAVIHHGIYVPQGILSAAARNAHTRVVTWNLAYRQRCFIFSHDDTYHHTLMDEPTDSWVDMPWSIQHERKVIDYIRSRDQGGDDWVRFYRKPERDFDQIAADLGIDRSKPIVLLLTNVVWDAQLHYTCNVFDGMLDWIAATVEAMARRPDLQLVIRVHPAELTGAVPSRQLVVEELRRKFPHLPKNVIVIPADHPASSYVLAEKSNVALIYASRMGVELAALGIPVIVAGEAWVRNKGITIDVRDREHYNILLAQLPLADRPNGTELERARKYAFHFFFRRMVPVDALEPRSGWPPFTIGRLDRELLSPGGMSGMDVICDGILKGTPFVYPAERELVQDSVATC